MIFAQLTRGSRYNKVSVGFYYSDWLRWGIIETIPLFGGDYYNGSFAGATQRHLVDYPSLVASNVSSSTITKF
jgi:hypothetical protein